jgi:hypothetical protein
MAGQACSDPRPLLYDALSFYEHTTWAHRYPVPKSASSPNNHTEWDLFCLQSTLFIWKGKPRLCRHQLTGSAIDWDDVDRGEVSGFTRTTIKLIFYKHLAKTTSLHHHVLLKDKQVLIIRISIKQ